MRKNMHSFYKPEYLKPNYYTFKDELINKNRIITQKEALFDLEFLMFLLTTASASCIEKYEDDDSDLMRKYNQILEILNKHEFITIVEFWNLLTTLINDIKDLHSHIFFYDEKGEEHFCSFGKRLIPYFSENYYLENDNKNFISVDNLFFLKGEKLDNNSSISLNKPYFIPVIKDKKIVYKQVVFTNKRESEFHLNTCINSNISIKYYMDKCDPNLLMTYYKKYETSKSSYWIFPPSYCSDEMKQFLWNRIETDIKCKDKKKILFIDNRANFGGIPFKQMKAIFSFLGIEQYFRQTKSDKKKCILEATTLLSYPVALKTLSDIENFQINEEQKENCRIYWKEILKTNKINYSWYKFEKDDLEEWEYNEALRGDISYNGRIVLIFSNDTSSWGETIYTFIKEKLGFNKLTLIGTNSRGCVSYANPYTYILPNSNLSVTLTSKTDADSMQSKFYKNIVECRGFIPDYWCTNDNELKETIDFLINQNNDESI